MSGAVGGMATGSGGGGGTGPRHLLCNGAPPTSPLIADFEDAVSVGPGLPVSFGTSPGLTGRIFTGASPGVAPPQLSIAAGAGGTRALRHFTAAG